MDDGAHTNISQIKTTINCINNINNDGLLIVEDTHTSYAKKYNTSKKYSFINFAKTIIDQLYKSDNSQNNKDNKFNFGNLIFSINFYQSCVIFNIDQNKAVQNKTISNNKLDNEIDDITFQYFLKEKSSFLGNMKLTKNLLRIYKKYQINKYLNKFFN